MHYIRFLKPPRLHVNMPTSSDTLDAKITVTTDLGESFLCLDVSLVVEIISASGTKLGQGREYIWKGRSGMRSLEVTDNIVNYKMTKGEHTVRMLVRPKEEKYAMDIFNTILSPGRNNSEESGGIVAVRSMAVSTNIPNNNKATPSTSLAERVFSSEGKGVHIWEETGESIARHIWDAGLVLSSYLTTAVSSTDKLHNLPILEQVFSKKNLSVLELGAGCGIVGIALSSYIPNTKIILTDLEEASEILTHNISLIPSSPKPTSTPVVTHQILDWSQPLPTNVSSQKWDMIVVADCTYNPDVVPDLVATLRGIAEGGSPDVYVLLAMKVRHDSEMVFFELMKSANFKVQEKLTIPLPVLGGEDEAIDIYGFKLDT